MTLQETLSRLSWGGEGYADYQGYAYMTGPETSAWNQLGYDTSVMNSWMTNQFKEMQGLLNQTIIPALKQMATNPQGFGAQALAAMRSQAIGSISEGYSSAVQAQQNAFASENLAGLGSGVEQAISANLAQTASGQEASAMNQINIANAQEQVQQQQFALSGLAQADQELGAVPQSAQIAAGLNQNELAASQSYYGQQSPMNAMLGSLAGTALTIGGGLIGGPAGAMIGSSIGGAISSGLGGSGAGGGSLASNWGSLGFPSIWGGSPTPSSTMTNYGGVGALPGGGGGGGIGYTPNQI